MSNDDDGLADARRSREIALAIVNSMPREHLGTDAYSAAVALAAVSVLDACGVSRAAMRELLIDLIDTVVPVPPGTDLADIAFN